MTDIPRGQGGDGSPQLDLDAAIDTLLRERDALRGRVEELSEALRALMGVTDGPVEWDSWRGIAAGTETPALMQARRLLAKVDPEKETP